MKKSTKKIDGLFAACIQHAFDEIQGQTGLSKEDLFTVTLVYGSIKLIGLIVVSTDYLPLALHSVGRAIFCGVPGSFLLQRIL